MAKLVLVVVSALAGVVFAEERLFPRVSPRHRRHRQHRLLPETQLERRQGISVEEPFFEHTMLCSHNSYAWGRQSNANFKGATAQGSTDVGTMETHLDLGYRCLELDVWPRTKPGSVGLKNPFGTKHLVVGHLTGTIDMTNHVPLADFLAAIVAWMVADEQRGGLTDHEGLPVLRTPIVISVENHADTDALEADMTKQFYGAFGGRIVSPSDFEGGPNGTPMVKLMGSRRRVILKSKVVHGEGKVQSGHVFYGGSKSSNWLQLVSMLNSGEKKMILDRVEKVNGKADGTLDVYTAAAYSKSIHIGGKTTTTILEDQSKAIAKQIAAGNYVRTYPSPLNTHSTNYHSDNVFALALDKGITPPQMVCVNFQGSCCEGTSKCTRGASGQAGNWGPYRDCDCNRQGAWQLEHLFKTYGEDGYIHWARLSDEAKAQFANFNSWSLDGQPYAGSEYQTKWHQGKCGSGNAHDETDDAGYVVNREE